MAGIDTGGGGHGGRRSVNQELPLVPFIDFLLCLVMFLLDTDALSELEKPQPNLSFLAWLDRVDWLALHLSVITIAELWKGISELPHSRKRLRLEGMFDLIPDRFQTASSRWTTLLPLRTVRFRRQRGLFPVSIL